jgi:uncharacterized protein (TIGR02217 family)
MGFHETRLPTGISYGARGGPGFDGGLIETDGSEEVIQRHEEGRRKYDIGYGLKEWDDLADVLEFFLARGGIANGFRFKDWSDFTTASDHISTHAYNDVQIGTGDGSETQFQLVKKYTSGSQTHTRNITKPVSGTVEIAFDGVEQTSGWTVDTTTGVVTFSVAPSLNVVITAGFEFDVPVRFAQDVDRDGLQYQIDHFDSGSIRGIGLVEMRTGLVVDSEYPYGGAVNEEMSANRTITRAEGFVWRLDPQSGSLRVYIPSKTGQPTGGPHFVIVNASGSYSLAIWETGGAQIGTIAASGNGVVVLDTAWRLLT